MYSKQFKPLTTCPETVICRNLVRNLLQSSPKPWLVFLDALNLTWWCSNCFGSYFPEESLIEHISPSISTICYFSVGSFFPPEFEWKWTWRNGSLLFWFGMSRDVLCLRAFVWGLKCQTFWGFDTENGSEVREIVLCDPRLRIDPVQ